MITFKSFGLILFLGLSMQLRAQSISLLDFVKIKDNKRTETIFYYEQNWRLYREAALREGKIKSYKIVEIINEGELDYDLILMTEFSDTTQFKLMEPNFEAIIKRLRPNGPALLNSLNPGEFRQNVFSKTASTLFEPN